MSLNALSNESFRRQVVARAQNAPSAFESGVVPSPATVLEAKAMTTVEDNAANKVTEAFVKYIPTEMLASFVAFLSVAPTFGWDSRILYIIWIIATPLVFLLIHLSKLASAGEDWPSPSSAAFKRLLYLACASTVAFAIWGLSVPTNVVLNDLGPILAALIAGIVSPLLTYLEPIVFRIIGD